MRIAPFLTERIVLPRTADSGLTTIGDSPTPAPSTPILPFPPTPRPTPKPERPAPTRSSAAETEPNPGLASPADHPTEPHNVPQPDTTPDVPVAEANSNPEEMPAAQNVNPTNAAGAEVAPSRTSVALVVGGQTLVPGGPAQIVAEKAVSMNSAGSMVVVSTGTGDGPPMHEPSETGDDPAVKDFKDSNGVPVADKTVTMDVAAFTASIASEIGTAVPASMVTFFLPPQTLSVDGDNQIGHDNVGAEEIDGVGEVVGGMGAYILSALGSRASQTGSDGSATPATQGRPTGTGSDRRNSTVVPFTGGSSIVSAPWIGWTVLCMAETLLLFASTTYS
ncbi:hypothetical protein BDZ85DRAFT_40971 [Elsinoe ampelina]|uniref:Uncharacterized protein n=1 Tax=Elsinoe ampelina TaxID=302913 RepID=A0A6A6G279_9PEZI|nr:hypothetical protein BDZ85DRAFT_40971 [Elsinoe ampelina]